MFNPHIIELKRAVLKGNLEQVKALLSARGYDKVSAGEKWDRGKLLYVTHSADITRELLIAGAPVNTPDVVYESPLHHAVIKDKEWGVVYELLGHGANVNAKDRAGNTPLNLAVKHRHKDLRVVELLLDYGADINIRNRELQPFKTTPLDNAIGYLPYAQTIIKFILVRNFYYDYLKIVDLRPYRNHRNFPKLVVYLKGCICELSHMESDFIMDNLPLYQLFVNDLEDNHNQLSLKLARTDFSRRYPLYNEIILTRLKPFLERAKLLKKFDNIQLYMVIDRDVMRKKIILNHYCTYNVTEYLSNDDLINCITVFSVSMCSSSSKGKEKTRKARH